METNEKLRVELSDLQVSANKMQRDLLEAQATASVKPIRTTVASRIMEDRIKTLEGNLDMKVSASFGR